ncbi:MAG: CehA/McbA family metallohydrolase [Verrucomicrobia bacterium]|nr:CehA/McbA family metallohydrolase [Verrucomicrobiota bacterium]
MVVAACSVSAAPLPIEKNVDWQPFTAQVRRLIEATDYLGSPFSASEKKDIEATMKDTETNRGSEKLQAILDRHCLFGVSINPEMRVKVAPGPAKPELVEQGWRQFLVKVVNESGTTADLQAVSPNAISVYSNEGVGPRNNESDKFYRRKGEALPLTDNAQLWLDFRMYDMQPLGKSLSGLPLEYRIIQLYSRDAGRREAKFSFNVGQGTQDIGFRNEVDTLFTCLPARTITFRVHDENNKPTTASFLIRDTQQRVYPSQAKRLAPDFPFHPQVYRGDGETLKLPDGEYTVEFLRGPESVADTQTLKVDKRTKQVEFKVKRWIDPSLTGWWSGDHHIHAAGCAHYVKPTEGVLASDMIRHCMGEDLKIGANLTWGPCFDYQKQFFCGAVDKVSIYPYLLRYDIEVSGFGSHQSGHLCLLRLKEEIYPGGDSKDHWPTLCLNTLRWAKKQGSVCGPAHSGWGLEVKTNALPNYIVPPFNQIGAMEYIVDVTHELPGPDGKLLPAVDFISMVDTPYVWELNMWYHTLNVGYRTRVSGETDFPCIYGEKVGLGRSYVKLDGKLDYDQWCEGIRQGRNYVSDGKSHLMEFKVNDVAMGEQGSELKLSQPASVKVTAKVAARLNDQPNPALQKLDYAKKPYWDIERARIDETREVPVEVIVNGYPVAKKNIVADGKLQDISFDVKIDRSSWVALRILPSSHSNPIFVLVDGKPVRASKRSAEWCLKGVDQCWSQKEKFIRDNEKEDAKLAYDHARAAYQKILGECDVD